MKIKIAILFSSLALYLAACSGDNSQNAHHDGDMSQTMPADTSRNQEQNQSGMAQIMNGMMNQMHGMKMTNDPETDFAGMMIMHHQGAIDMANRELQEGTDANMKSMAQKIIADQTREIQELKDFLAANSADNNVPAYSSESMENMKKSMQATQNQPLSGNVDMDFAALMKVHHQSATDDARTYLKHGNNEKLKAMANGMIGKQEQEINELTAWLASK